MSFHLIQLAFIISLCHAFTLPNTDARFQNTPQPFEINVNETFIQSLRERVRIARPPVVVQGVQNDGTPLANFTTLQEHWVNGYNWTVAQNTINDKFDQFTTIVQSNASSYKYPTPLHFVHHKSPRKDAIPLLFVHGWPGNFLEVTKIIEPLTNPPNSSAPAFHVVAPSIPGFGFSPAPEHDGFGPKAAAHTLHALMLQLGYKRYVSQGGDFGAVITEYQASLYPQSVVSHLSNFWVVQPNPSDIVRLSQNLTTSEEAAYIGNIETFIHQRSGYRLIQETQPLTLAYALTDSPIGFALWIYSLMRESVDPTDFQWQTDEVITWSLMYTIQGPYAGLRFYEEALADGAFRDFEFGDFPYIHQPVAISEFPKDLWYGLPLEWAQRRGNVKVRNVHDRGGHFAAYEVPDLLVADIRRWFGDEELSGTKVFTSA